MFHVGVEHRHKISFLILNITLIYQIVKTDFQMNDIIIYRSYMAFDPHTRTGSDAAERERYSVVPFFESGP